MNFKIFSLSKLRLLSLILFSNIIFSQTNDVGLSIQGIASDSNNTPIANATNLALTTEIYTVSSSGVNTIHITNSTTVITDAFGVFSFVLPISSSDFSDLENFDARIKVKMGSNNSIILDQSLVSVPFSIYAQSALNGVPVGSILPYTGGTIPEGYLLCNGQSLDNNDHSALIALLGSTTVPDLRGVYLRGAGSQTMNYDGSGGNSDFNGKTYSAGSINSYNEGSFESHRHIFNLLTGSPKDDNQALNKVSGTNRWELNYTNKVNPSGRNDGDLRWRLRDGVIQGDTDIDGWYANRANKVADGGGKYAWIRGSEKTFAWGGDGPIIWADGSGTENKEVIINPHQHRIYGKTWYSNPSSSNNSTYGDSGLTPGPTFFESAPVWYNVNYIIKY